MEWDGLKLPDLEPRWYALPEDCGKRLYRARSISAAKGVQFLCPKCFAENGGSVGTHAVLCWTPDVPLTVPPAPGRWLISGTGFHDLTLTSPKASSVNLTAGGGCGAHFFVQGGRIQRVRERGGEPG